MSNKLPRGTLDKLWSNPDNWSGLGVYSCQDDPRVIVPKRQTKMGWTMNFANPWAWPAIVIVVGAISLPAIYFKVQRAPVDGVIYVCLCIVVLVFVCQMMSSTDKYED